MLALAPFSLIILVVLFIPQVSQRLGQIFSSKQLATSLFLIYFFMLLIMSYLTLTLYLPINILLTFINPERVLQHIFIFGTILTAVVVFFFVYLSYLGIKRLFGISSNLTKLRKLNKNTIFTFVLLILLLFNFALLSIPIIKEQQGVYDQAKTTLHTYETLNQNDMSLMNWVIENIPSTATTLVSSGDSGQFLAAVTERKACSPPPPAPPRPVPATRALCV
ncbi:MAG: hypothetical protein LAN18_11410 [Acidobacteriia bacterium]|nr:hypothetical protein [Terriglobia bacterium]